MEAAILSAEVQQEIIEQIAGKLHDHYVFPQVGRALSQQLRESQAQGRYAALKDPHAFSHVVTAELFAASQDHHLRLWYDPAQAAATADAENDHEALLRHHFEQAQRVNFGFARVERLAGNIGYLDIRELPPPEAAGQVAAGVMAFLTNTHALIIDLRYNGDGTAEMVQLLASYLFDAQPRPLSGIYSSHNDTLLPASTLSEIPGQTMSNVPVFVLISGMTFSAAEALAYDLQALGRAVIVGQRSRGGAHLVDYQVIAGDYLFTLSVARAVNPLTGTNWEGRGVIPDMEAASEQALVTAHRAALNDLLAQAASEADRRFLHWEMASLEARLRPAVVEPEQLGRYPGRYGDREIVLEGGMLYCRQKMRSATGS